MRENKTKCYSTMMSIAFTVLIVFNASLCLAVIAKQQEIKDQQAIINSNDKAIASLTSRVNQLYENDSAMKAEINELSK